MVSPAKKRKLDSGSKQTSVPSRGLEYFFSKQRQNGARENGSSATPSAGAETGRPEEPELTDEELARRLQAEWDAEVRSGATATQPISDPGSGAASSGGGTESPIRPPSPRAAASLAGTAPIPQKSLSLSSAAATEDRVSASIPLDQNPLSFNPADYVAQLRESWSADGHDASYALLTRCFVLVNSTASRIKIVDTLVNCVRLLIEADPASLLPAVWLATNAISPPYISLELGLGGSAISKALKNVCGLDSRSLKAIYDKLGDPGDVAFEAKKKQSFTLRKPKPLTIKGSYQSLVKIAKTQGQGSAEIKQRIVDRLLQDARGGEESRYIVRTLCQHAKLRIGAVKTTMLIALSRAFILSRPSGAGFSTRDPKELANLKKEDLAEVWARGEEIVKASFARHPNYDDLVPALLEVGTSDELLVRCGLTLHVPLRPMLGSITRDLSEMLTKLQGRDFACEYKYDGQRAQVHCDAAGKVSIFSRHLELMTDKYPDLVALVPEMRGAGVGSFIMEGEVVAVDQQTGELKSFQTLANRARKDVQVGSITVDVCLFAFDLMYLDGQPLLDRPFRERRQLLRSLFVEIPNRFSWVRSIDATSQDSEAVLEFFKSATETKCEGIMVKILDNLPNMEYGGGAEDAGAGSEPATLADALDVSHSEAPQGGGDVIGKPTEKNLTGRDGSVAKKPKSTRRKALLATYEPDKRLDSWLKVKKDYSSSSDTLDLVPVAGWHGQGRKARWWSPILLAVRNEDTGSLEVVCKCMSGFTDVFYKANRAFYDDGRGDGEGEGEPKNTHARKPALVEYPGGAPAPDVWFEPQEVWEVAFADVTLSPTYTAAIGLVSEDRGLSLRFPRFMKRREDKSIDEASTSEFLAALWRKQEARMPAGGAADGNPAEEEE